MEAPEIPGYRIQGELGRGARGVVYRAQRGGVTYAVKLPNDPNDRSLLACGAILACMRHPGLPEVVEVGEIQGRPYMVREYVAGYSLAAELEAGPLNEPELVEMAKTLAGALDQVHRHGLIHRDVKPANIVLSRTGGARLIDFGFATRIDSKTPEQVGTYLYAAPEQSGVLDAPVDQRSDLYALGAVLYHCAAGRPPYQAESTAQLLQLHASAPVPELPEVSPALARIIAKLLSKDPRDRYQTGGSLLADLRALTKLNARIQEGQAIALGESSQDLPSQLGGMVGREAELAELSNALQRAQRGQGESALVEGEGGSGKSMLAREFLTRAAASRPLVLQARCERGLPPYAPVRAWVEAYFAQMTGLPAVQQKALEAELRSFAQEHGPLLGKLGPAAETFFGEPESLPDSSDRFLDAASGLLLLLARLHGTLLLYLDDAHHLDEGTHQVIRRLRRSLDEAPLMLLASVRSSLESRQGLELYLRSAQPSLRIALEPLGKPDVELLIYSLLGSRPVDSELVHQVAVRSHGNPFATVEYVRAMLHSGVVLPTLEGWRVDHQRLQGLALPNDVLELILQRVAQLPEDVRKRVTTAAVLGARFQLRTLQAIEPGDLDVAVQANILEQPTAGVFVFVHDRIREAFLAELPPEEVRARHQRIARGLEKLLANEPELGYAVARHYALGDGAPEKVYETNLHAGLMALRDFAFEDAYQFLSQAARTGTRQAVMEPLSLACERTNRVEEAIGLLEQLLQTNPEPLQKAQVLHRLSKLQLSKLDRAQAREGCRQALAAAGKPVLDHPLWNGFAAAYYFGLYLLADATGVGRGKTRARAREETLAELYQSYSEGEYFEMRYPKMLEMGARACLAGHQLGVSRQFVTSHSNMMIWFGMLRKSKLVENRARKIEKIAAQLGDPVSQSHLEVMRHIALHIAGECGAVEEGLDRVLTQKGHLIESWVYLIGVADQAWVLMMRGYMDQAWSWVQKGIQRCKLTSSPAGVARDLDILSCYAISCLAVLGRPSEALTYVERLKDKCANSQVDRSLRANYFAHLLMLHREGGELGEPLDATGNAFLDLGLLPVLAPLHRRHFYVLWAYCLLDRKQDSPQLDRALKLLKKTANRPLLKAHYLCALAGREHLRGRHHEALKLLAEADILAGVHDAPWVTWEAARWRARTLSALGRSEAASREGTRAYQLAVDFGWPARAREAAREFTPGRSAGSVSTSAVRRGRSEDPGQVSLTRQLDALLHISLASARMLNPLELARAVLDELINVLNAERAYLFLHDEGGLDFVTGRDRGGETLTAPTGYSRTVVETVQSSREPLVIAGTEEGEAIGSASVVAHDLRSIICAPMCVGDQLVGVVYLDNRLARGVFTEEDIQILTALSSQIAVNMVTALAARLEVEVESERQRRELADILSHFTSSLSETFEAPAILEKLLDTLHMLIPFERAAVWSEREGKLCMTVARGYSEWTSRRPVEPSGPLLEALESGRPVLETTDQEPGLSEQHEPFSWLGLPLAAERQVVALSCGEPLDDYAAEVAFTFCNQAAIALARARLFEEIHRLATTDALTGVLNRRRLLELAGGEHSAVIMDVDHFKRFNDTHGHALGDLVLKHVARTCQECVGRKGLFGRYGGEEFVAFLPAPEAEELAERMRSRVEASPVENAGRTLKVTMSLGVAHRQPEETLDQLLHRADSALYEAKAGGRNRVVLAGEAQAGAVVVLD